MSNANVNINETNLGLDRGKKMVPPKRMKGWKKVPLILTIAIVAIFVSFYMIGIIMTGRIETITDPQALGSWGQGTSFLETRSGTTHILDIGEGEVILLVHGSTGSIADWQEKVASPLAESYRVVAFDSYGFGLSDRKAASKYGHALWEQQAIDVLDALKIDSAVVLGHSAGAMTADLLAADYPERFNGVVLTGHSFAGDPLQMLPFLPGIGEVWAARQSIIGDMFSSSYTEQAETVHQIRGTRAAYLAFMRSQYYSPTSFRLFDRGYEEIEVPVLQVHGTLDLAQAIEPAMDLSSRLTDTRFVAIEGSGHFVHIEAPDQWLEAVTTFVNDLQP